ncbi:MAG TPA: hypothetical protein QGF58_14345 [Myxococcota bacterium]|nr:hypothetical protein [Myxococcota bacterium]
MLLAILLSTAEATELSTTFPTDEPVHYRVQMGLKTGTFIQIHAREDLDAFLGDVTMLLLMSCTGAEPTKRDQQVDCAVERAMLSGHGKGREQAEIDAILEEYAGYLQGATIQLVVTTSGRFKSVDVEGIPKDSKETADAQEFLRDLVARGVGPLDIEMPKGGVDPGGSWKQKSSAGVRHPGGAATGTVKIETTVKGADGDLVVFEQDGDGLLETLDSANRGLNQKVVVHLEGTASYDSERHIITGAEQRVVGEYTASAERSALVIDQLAQVDRQESLEPLIEEFDAALK